MAKQQPWLFSAQLKTNNIAVKENNSANNVQVQQVSTNIINEEWGKKNVASFVALYEMLRERERERERERVLAYLQLAIYHFKDKFCNIRPNRNCPSTDASSVEFSKKILCLVKCT